jgi:hypothetical protein
MVSTKELKKMSGDTPITERPFERAARGRQVWEAFPMHFYFFAIQLTTKRFLNYNKKWTSLSVMQHCSNLPGCKWIEVVLYYYCEAVSKLQQKMDITLCDAALQQPSYRWWIEVVVPTTTSRQHTALPCTIYHFRHLFFCSAIFPNRTSQYMEDS